MSGCAFVEVDWKSGGESVRHLLRVNCYMPNDTDIGSADDHAALAVEDEDTGEEYDMSEKELEEAHAVFFKLVKMEDSVEKVSDLRDTGHAVVVFNPSELAGADVGLVEDRLVELGWDVIGALCTYKEAG